jgi:hypothetical protein
MEELRGFFRVFSRSRKRRIRFTFMQYSFKIIGEEMTFTMLSNQSVSVVGSPVDASGNPSKATLSNISYSSSDSTVFTVAADPATPGGAIITGVGAGTATLSESATATEPDGVTTESVTGTATITLTTSGSGVAASLVFTFGAPTSQAAPPVTVASARTQRIHVNPTV